MGIVLSYKQLCRETDPVLETASYRELILETERRERHFSPAPSSTTPLLLGAYDDEKAHLGSMCII